MNQNKYGVGDRVGSVNSSIVGTGTITDIIKGGEEIGFPWKDETTHYGFIDEKTGQYLIFKEDMLEEK